MLVDAGLTLPEGVLLDNRFRGMSAEQIYNLLETEPDSEDGSDGEDQIRGSGDGNATPAAPEQVDDSEEPSAPDTEGGIGQVLDAPEAEMRDPALRNRRANGTSPSTRP